MNSGPLSIRSAPGAPREPNRCSNIWQTRSKRNERPTLIESDSRVNSSLTHRTRNFAPSSVASSTKSRHHTALG
jgi:hypothetical protein